MVTRISLGYTARTRFTSAFTDWGKLGTQACEHEVSWSRAAWKTRVSPADSWPAVPSYLLLPPPHQSSQMKIDVHKILKITPTFPYISCLSGVKFTLLKPSYFVLWFNRAVSTHALGVILWQGQGIWGEAVEICTCTEVAERGKHGRAMDTETFAFLLKRISKCANNTCCWKLLVCADVLKGLEDQLKSVLNYRGTTSTKGEWTYVQILQIPDCGVTAGQPLMRIRITYRSTRVWLVCFLSCCQKIFWSGKPPSYWRKLTHLVF